MIVTEEKEMGVSAARTNPADSGEFVFSRVLDAPRQRVWRAFTEADQLAQWWGPKGFKLHVAKLDLRPGGVFLYRMRSANGQEMWGKFVYREIKAPDGWFSCCRFRMRRVAFRATP